MRVVMTAEAQRQARAERQWWRQHRDAKLVFGDELRQALRRLARGPALEVYGTIRGVPVQRLLLPRTRVHVYYTVSRPDRLVTVIAIWGAGRGTPPPLVDPSTR